MVKFEKILHIYAGDIPYELRDELFACFDCSICLHGDDGSVNHFGADSIEACPKFTQWMIEQGAWTPEEIDLPTYERFCRENNLNYPDEPYHFEEYRKYKGDREEVLTVAFTGT